MEKVYFAREVHNDRGGMRTKGLGEGVQNMFNKGVYEV